MDHPCFSRSRALRSRAAMRGNRTAHLGSWMMVVGTALAVSGVYAYSLPDGPDWLLLVVLAGLLGAAVAPAGLVLLVVGILGEKRLVGGERTQALSSLPEKRS